MEAGHATRRAPSKADSVFHFALADTAPDAWGRRVIEQVLALALSRRAGVNTAIARAVPITGTALALIERFDRAPGDKRIPYLSAASMLQASREATHAYTEIVDLMRQRTVATGAIV